MKYRDEDGNFQEVYFKATDTLPIGTEVDYDGEEAPFGWEEITSPFAVLTGIIPGSSLTPSDYQLVEVNYPSGFNLSNCVVISTMVEPSGTTEYSEYEGKASTSLNSNKILISFAEAQGVDMNYRVVLMKLPTQTQGGNE